MKKLLQAAAVTVLGVGLTGGIASAATGTIDTTGPNSNTKVVNVTSNHTHVHNHTSLGVNNSAYQSSYTGDAKVKNNTTGGSATTGDAANSNAVAASATVDNSMSVSTLGAGAGSGDLSGDISNTGPNSNTKVVNKETNDVSVHNTTNISVNNMVSQDAVSGDAKVQNNTTGGDATTGNATNTSSSTFTFNVTN